MDTLRLSKFLAQCGVASRRKADDIIRSGSVSVNGEKVFDPYIQVDPEHDSVTVSGIKISLRSTPLYFALYKPASYMSDLKDARGRTLAVSLIESDARLFPVGRLDYHSEGLMIFTTDGAFANRVMHPRYEVEKEYLVKLNGRLEPTDVEAALKGITVDGVRYMADAVELVRHDARNAWYRFTVHEGKNRLIRKLADGLGHPVRRLIRLRIGPVRLGRLKPGQHRRLTKSEIDYFLQARE